MDVFCALFVIAFLVIFACLWTAASFEDESVNRGRGLKMFFAGMVMLGVFTLALVGAGTFNCFFKNGG